MRALPPLILFVAYLGFAKLGIALPVGEGVVTPIWAPTGIALAALTLYRWRLWPAVFAAAFVANATSGVSIAIAAGIAIGNTGQAIIGAYLLHRLAFEPSLRRTRDVAALVATGISSCVVSATNGVNVLWLADQVSNGDYLDRWTLWWFGDVMGVFVASSLIFAVTSQRNLRPTLAPRRLAELSLLITLLASVSVLVFAGEEWRYPWMLLPFMVWAALRFRAIGSSGAMLVTGAIGVGFTINGTVAIDGLDATHTVQLIQAMLAVVGISLLVISAALTERDVSRVQLETALRDEQEVARKLRLVDEMKDSLLAVVSHELRTPLTSILGLSMMLKDRRGELDEDKLAEMHDHLSREARRLDSLLGDLLDLERLRLGLLEPRFEPVDVAALVRSGMDRFATSARPIKLDLEHVTVEADAAKIERIVDNLIGNAYKHTPMDGRVFVKVFAVDAGVMIAVDDEGAGVPDAYKVAVFEPFNRGTADLSHAPGTGIGLSLVSHFTNLHGGRSWVEDRDGGGASFRVFLPSTREG